MKRTWWIWLAFFSSLESGLLDIMDSISEYRSLIIFFIAIFKKLEKSNSSREIRKTTNRFGQSFMNSLEVLVVVSPFVSIDSKTSCFHKWLWLTRFSIAALSREILLLVLRKMSSWYLDCFSYALWACRLISITCASVRYWFSSQLNVSASGIICWWMIF